MSDSTQARAAPQKATVLVVDDTAQNVQLLAELLRGKYRVKVALSGKKALAAVAREVPDLILLDVMMPDLDGYEVCRRLKEDPLARRVPVIFITAKNEIEDEERGFQLGAVDYITKPISRPIVLARVRAQLALYSQRRALESEVQARTDELARANSTLHEEVNQRKKAMERAEYLFNHDVVTGLPNRRQFAERLERAVERAKQDGERLALVGVSLDRFNMVKSKLGAALCDQLLIETSQRLQRRVHSTDVLARTGGEEFSVLLMCEKRSTAACAEEADALTRRTLVDLAQAYDFTGGRAEVTASGGFALFPDDAESAGELMRRMELTLEYVKLAGGNHSRRYDRKVDAGSTAAVTMESRIREALKAKVLTPYYQPKVQVGSHRIVGAETLVRWPLPDGA